MRVRRKTVVITALLLALAAFLGWRFVRPMNIFVVSEAFERPIPTDRLPPPLKTLSARECGACHREFYEEWRTAMHSQAWTDPYFQADWRYDRRQQICKNCHTPLDRQQEHRVLGFRDRAKWDPILAPNPAFDPDLQHEGVTCAACHFRDGAILGPFGLDGAPHPVRRLSDPNQVCVRCHVVQGERWDTFYKLPPCGTVAEIGRDVCREKAASANNPPFLGGRSGELRVEAVAGLGCVDCHMPRVERPLVAGGAVRPARRHLWRGGHDPAMVKRGLTIRLEATPADEAGRRRAVLTLINTGAAHYLPTGTPDRHLTVVLRLLDAAGRVLEEQRHTLRRTILWRPFIIDLWDTRLPHGEPRRYALAFREGRAAAIEAVVRYHLLDERRRRRIGYENTTPISYEVFRQRLGLVAGTS